MNIAIDITLIIIWLLWTVILRKEIYTKWYTNIKSVFYWLSIFILTYFSLDLIGNLL